MNDKENTFFDKIAKFYKKVYNAYKEYKKQAAQKPIYELDLTCCELYDRLKIIRYMAIMGQSALAEHELSVADSAFIAIIEATEESIAAEFKVKDTEDKT